VLDVGCGPGTITADLAARVPGGEVTGIRRGLRRAWPQARQEAERRGQRNVRFGTGDVYHLGFEDGTFDVVHAHQVLQHLTDPVAALREMRRVLPTGRAGRRAGRGLRRVLLVPPGSRNWTSGWRCTGHVARAIGGEPDAGRHMLAWARQAGFASVEGLGQRLVLHRTQDRTWWGHVVGAAADRIAVR